MLYKNEEWLKNMYNKYGSSYIAKKCNVTDKTIIYWLNKFNIKVRTRKESLEITSARKYKVDENYFNKIDTKEKAYWLGFLMADGTVREYKKNRYQLTFELKSTDSYIIEEFNQNIKSNYNLIKNKSRCRLIITNSKFVLNIIKHGVIPHKSGQEIFPDIKQEFNKDFIRGFFDGDGSIQFKNNGTRIRSKFHLVSCSKTILKKIKEVFEQEAKVKFTEKSLHLKTNTNHIYELETSSLTEIAKIYDYLYYDNCLNLIRKENIFKDFLTYYKTSNRLIKRYSPNH